MKLIHTLSRKVSTETTPSSHSAWLMRWRLSMILLDAFPAAGFQLRSPPQDLVARVLKIHRGLSQFGVLLSDCLRYLIVKRIHAAAQLVNKLCTLLKSGLRE